MINQDLIPVRYITGTYRYADNYPTPEDLMWDIVSFGKKTVSADSIDWIEEEKKEEILECLQKAGFISIENNKINILKTYWDGRSYK